MQTTETNTIGFSRGFSQKNGRTKFKRCTIKLGGKCNLNCPHCHCRVSEFHFNPDLIEWIRANPIQTINFNGGEPLLYFDRIRYFIDTLGDSYNYKFVTNGTRLSEKIIDYLNDHNVTIIVSFDGLDNGGRDTSELPRWELLRFAKKCAFSVYTSKSKNTFDIQDDLYSLMHQFHIKQVYNRGSCMPNFLHETEEKTESFESIETYLKTLTQMIELQIIQYKQDGYLGEKQALQKSIRKWLQPKNYEFGVACCNSETIPVTLDGRFMICPYKEDYCGDIYTGVDLQKMEDIIPDQCKRCPIFDVCRVTCIKNVTNHECFISHKMNEHLKKLEKKYSINLLELI